MSHYRPSKSSRPNNAIAFRAYTERKLLFPVEIASKNICTLGQGKPHHPISKDHGMYKY